MFSTNVLAHIHDNLIMNGLFYSMVTIQCLSSAVSEDMCVMGASLYTVLVTGMRIQWKGHQTFTWCLMCYCEEIMSLPEYIQTQIKDENLTHFLVTSRTLWGNQHTNKLSPQWQHEEQLKCNIQKLLQNNSLYILLNLDTVRTGVLQK